MRNRLLVAVIVLLLTPVLRAQAPAPPHPLPFDITTCQACHSDVFTLYQHTFHAKKIANQCAACHGDVAAHAAAEMAGEGKGPIISFKTLNAADTNTRCLTCHDRARQANWHGGVHERRGLSCTTCHSVHSFKSEHAQLKTVRASDTCYTCHSGVRSQMMRTSHHPVREGKLDCGSCHDPHANAQKALLKADSVNELCYTCHADKRGPFVWEHSPVRENCTTCHIAHGSNHEMLLVNKEPFLCQRCHLNTRHPGTLYDQRHTLQGPTTSNRMIGHSCTNCHLNVHGSNQPATPFFGR